MESYLVTGGEGFIGRNLCSAIRKSGGKALTLDHSGNPDFKGSVCDYGIVEKASADVDGIFHLAAVTSPPQFEEDIVTGFETNVNGTLNVLRAAVRNGVRRVVFASSSSTYGNLRESADESRISYEHQNMYPLTKVFGEFMGKFFDSRKETEFLAVRYFNTYGNGENTKSLYASVIWRFVNNALKSEDMIVYGDGRQSRDFVYVKDVAEATLSVFMRGRSGESYNVGSGKTYMFNDIARTVKDITGSTSGIAHVDNPLKNYQMFTLSDISKIKKDTGWEPRFSLESGIKEMISDLK